MITEVIRLPVSEGGAEPLLDFMRSHAYFEQDAVQSARLFSGENGDEVLVIVEWTSREAEEAAGSTPVSEEFRSTVRSLLAGAPDLAFYTPED